MTGKARRGDGKIEEGGARSRERGGAMEGEEGGWGEGVDGKRRADAVVRGEGGDAAGDSRQWFARVRGRGDLTSLAAFPSFSLTFFPAETSSKTPIDKSRR